MSKVLWFAVLWAALPMAAQIDQFDKIRTRHTIHLVLPSGYCEAKVMESSADSLQVKLKETTAACGVKDAAVWVPRHTVRDVVPRRMSAAQRARRVTIRILAGTILFSYGFGIAFLGGNYGVGIPIMLATTPILYLLLPHPARFDVFVGELAPVAP